MESYKTHTCKNHQNLFWVFFFFFFGIVTSGNALFQQEHEHFLRSVGELPGCEIRNDADIWHTGRALPFPPLQLHVPTSPGIPWKVHPQKESAGVWGTWHCYSWWGVCPLHVNFELSLDFFCLLNYPAQRLRSLDSNIHSFCHGKVVPNTPHSHDLPTCPRTSQFSICKIGKIAFSELPGELWRWKALKTAWHSDALQLEYRR